MLLLLLFPFYRLGSQLGSKFKNLTKATQLASVWVTFEPGQSGSGLPYGMFMKIDLQADRCPRKDERSQLMSAAAGSTGQEVKL